LGLFSSSLAIQINPNIVFGFFDPLDGFKASQNFHLRLLEVVWGSEAKKLLSSLVYPENLRV